MRFTRRIVLSVFVGTVLLAILGVGIWRMVEAEGVGVPDVSGQAVVNIHQATLMEPDQKTPEISTHELRQLLAEQSATIFDARPFDEYAVSHIPGAITV